MQRRIQQNRVRILQERFDYDMKNQNFTDGVSIAAEYQRSGNGNE
jgi:hypothetical protein